MFPVKDNIPTDRFPLITVMLIAVNVLAYVLSVWHGGGFFSGPDLHTAVKWGAIPYNFSHGGSFCGFMNASHPVACLPHPAYPHAVPYLQTAFSSMFLHGSAVHLGVNMLFLWIFGNNVEDSVGRIRFIAFYLLGGLVPLALQAALEPNSLGPAIGAGGPVAAVLGGYLLLYPRARVLTLVLILLFFTVIELPVLALLVAWMAGQAIFAATHLSAPTIDSGMAFVTQSADLVFGILTIRLIAKRRKPTPPRQPLQMA